MGKKNAVEKTSYINSQYKNYIRSSFNFGKSKLQRMFVDALSKEELVKGPYIDLVLPFERGKSINDLISEGVLCKNFSKLNIKSEILNRPLYSHQEKSIRLVSSGHNAVITTGTGSGKTESFLYPILNELTNEVELGTISKGMRALLLYPMNALINDQIERIRELLFNIPDVTYAFFTGDTPEKVNADYRDQVYDKDGVEIPNNELVSREEIRDNPPNILITNYSMLEYLLIRPNDSVLFQEDNICNWKYVVLDEAHTYSGTQGIEVSMLLNRLTSLSEKKPQFILTSATLGKKGESEGDIVAFASTLTMSSYDINDIVFANRIPLDNTKVKYRLRGQDYIDIYNSLNDEVSLKGIISKYISDTTGSIEECLYDLLIADENVHTLYKILKEGVKEYSVVKRDIKEDLSHSELTTFIDLINVAVKGGINIYELKYHSFVRPLSGAYVSLGANESLSFTKQNEINGFKAFEVGNCIYCRAPYIIGKISKKGVNGEYKLIQNNEVDLYENYGTINDDINKKVDYFIFDNDFDEPNPQKVEELELCVKCGSLQDRKNLNSVECECEDIYKKRVYHVQIDSEIDNNNITECPCCGNISTRGVIKNLNMGKDEGTALIAQFLYDSLGENSVEMQKTAKLSLSKKNVKTTQEINNRTKQFLTFSDSRQQASFHAVFFDDKNIRILQKRLIWEALKNNNFEKLSINSLTSEVASIIKKYNLFDYDENEDRASVYNMTPHKNAWAAVLTELLKIDGGYGGEGLGLFHFNLDLHDVLDEFSEEDVREELGKYDIGKKELETLIQVVFGVFKTTPAINYSKSELTPEERKKVLDYRSFTNSVAFKLSKGEKNVHSLIPIKNSNSTLDYVAKVCKCDKNEACSILDIIFNNIGVEGEILSQEQVGKNNYQINAERYILNNYKNSTYYQCNKCGTVTPYNVHDCCIKDKCDGKLEAINPDDVFADNYYRNIYMNRSIESVIIKEHTAQLSRVKGKEYQNAFKEGKINILSCSTTFEMGIDLGQLETVFMRNVPPSPANYVQRAGRAGRRRGSSAYILTYCSDNSHDYTYYSQPERMIAGVINPPHFDVMNDKIIKRHLMASSLGYFFKSNPSSYKDVNAFVFEKGIDKFRKYIENRPKDLSFYLDEKVLKKEKFAKYRGFKWYDDLNEYEVRRIDLFEDSIKGKNSEYESAIKECLNNKDYRQADYFSRQIEFIKKKRVIDSLSEYCVIPKYGFPVDVVELEIYSKDGKSNKEYNLSRDLQMAISEYAPGSEIIVDGLKYVSKYITLPHIAPFARHYFGQCKNCNTYNVLEYVNAERTCKSCGESLDNLLDDYFIEPIFGFKTGEVTEGSARKPKKSYVGEVNYLGGGYPNNHELNIDDLIKVKTTTEDELLVMNRSRFTMCAQCGYSAKITTKALSKSHHTYTGRKCDCETFERMRLGHRFKTDVARLTVPFLSDTQFESTAVAYSFMYAFLEGMSIVLNIERTDIDGIIEHNVMSSRIDVLIYDNVPGGAGYVKRLIDANILEKVLKEAHKKVSQDCCAVDTSCYKCLRNYYNQSVHKLLKRQYAKDMIETMIKIVTGR